MISAQKARQNLVARQPGVEAQQQQDAVATVSVDPAPVVRGETITISGTITNNTDSEIGLEPQHSIQHGSNGIVITEGLQSFNVSSTTIPPGGSITYTWTYDSRFTNQLDLGTQSIETYLTVLGTPVLIGSRTVTVVDEAEDGDGGAPDWAFMVLAVVALLVAVAGSAGRR